MRSSQHVLLLLLSLLSVGRSAPLSDCESLTRPLEFQRDQLLGNWTHLAKSSNIPESNFVAKVMVDAAWGHITPIEDNGLKNSFTFKKFGSCFSVSTNYTVENNTISTEKPFVGTGVLLPTSCPDCIVLYINFTVVSDTASSLHLHSRRSQVTPAEMDEFNKQVKCLNLWPPATLNSEQGICPAAFPESGTKDLTHELNNMNQEAYKKVNNYMRIAMFLQKIKKGIAASKQNEHK